MQSKTGREGFGAPYFILMFINAMVSIAFYMIAPILTKYLVGVGVALAVASTIAGLMSITALCVRPFTGIIGDRLAPKQVLSVSIPTLGLSMVLYTVSNALPMIVFARILNGVAFSINGTVLIAYASRFIPESRMGEGIGYMGLGAIVASAIGPNLGVSLGEHLGYKANFYAAALICAAAVLMLQLIRDTSPRPAADPGAKAHISLKDLIAVEIIPISFLNGLFSFANGTVTNFLVLSAEDRGISNCGLYFTVLAVFLVVLRPIAGRISDKYSLSYILIPAYIATGFGILLIAHAPSLPLILSAAVLMAFGQGGGQPAIQARCVKELGPARRGVATSTYYIFADVFQGIGPTIGGVIAQRTDSYEAVFHVASGILFAGLGLFLLLQLWRKKRGKQLY